MRAGEHLQPHVSAIYQVITAGLQHEQVSVQTAAVRCVEPILGLISNEQEVAGFHAVVHAMLGCAQKALQQGDEILLVLVCSCLTAVAESPMPLLQPALPAVLQMCMAVAGNDQFEGSTRQQALQLTHWMARWGERGN